MKNRFKAAVNLGPVWIGPGHPPLIVAEIGGNHGGDPGLARQMIDAAAQAGAPAVKFQAYRTGRFLRRSSQYYDELKNEELSFAELSELASYTRNKGLLFLASVFDSSGVAWAGELGLPAVKIASGDLNNLPLLAEAARLGRPIILSTGASDLLEIDRSLDFLSQKGADQVVLLQCTALYPCPEEEVNLRVIQVLAERYGLPAGFSDHSLGTDLAVAAMALGACLVEKHFTIDRRLPGGDNSISCQPEELEAIVRSGARLAAALGDRIKQTTAKEMAIQIAIRRSVVTRREVAAGERLGPENMTLKRPGDGLEPAAYFDLLGRRVKTDLPADEPLTWDQVE